MIFNKEESFILVSQEEISIENFLQNLENEYAKLKNDNLVIDLLGFSKLTPYNVISFLEIAKKYKKNGQSFVLVSNKVSYDDVPDEINLVPTIKEARDIVEMEEIERDLGL
ncbi:ribonuclease Z [Maribacter hydrothermalis]|uniref:Ribonuclease Z n=1 Tax=Maribacter hydrothermalis TaxID=1836467 RepID=A0A1B7ZBN6_9FLAO|nr:ribonuclease Z [Maribacter hydrothermalis]APQ16305.1 ribonuclease Z [Maribacter hydrothermalis]OBR40127.1 ribonuclease Z [Maribacter hydrothermalis]